MEHNHAAMACLFRRDAARYRKLAGGTLSRTIAERLTAIAEECERDAALLAEGPGELPGKLSDKLSGGSVPIGSATARS